MRPSARKRKHGPCSRCTPLVLDLRQEIKENKEKVVKLRAQVVELRTELTGWENLGTNYGREMANQQFAPIHMHEDSFSADQLQIPHFQSYYEELLQRYPILRFIMNLLLSMYHLRKSKAYKTSSQWLEWAGLYKAFICEMLLRSRNAKVTLRLPILLAMYFLLHKVSDPVWRILQRLKIISSREKVEKWLQSQPEPEVSGESDLLFSFDNCDFFRHVTHVRSDHRSTYIHCATQYVVLLSKRVVVSTANLWRRVLDDDFYAFCEMDFTLCNQLANNCYTAVGRVVDTSWLKLAPYNDSRLQNSKLIVLKPLMNCNTAHTTEVRRVLENFYHSYIAGTSRTYAFVSCDQPVFNLCWKLRSSENDQFSWVIPVPGEFHWHWHILKGIFRIYGEYLFVPMSRVLNYTSLDVECKIFHYAEDFLQILSIALYRWARELMRTTGHEHLNDLLHYCHDNSQVYELLYLLFYYICPYWVSRSAVKSGSGHLLSDLWRYWIHLFITARKFKYTQLSVRFLWLQQALHPLVRQLYFDNRAFSFSGEELSGVAYDAINELVDYLICVCLHIILT